MVAPVCLQVVQVFTYMLTPLMARNDHPSSQQRSSIELQTPATAGQQQEQQEQEVQEQRDADANRKADKGVISGWQLRLIMEYCDQVGAYKHCLKALAHRMKLN